MNLKQMPVMGRESDVVGGLVLSKPTLGFYLHFYTTLGVFCCFYSRVVTMTVPVPKCAPFPIHRMQNVQQCTNKHYNVKCNYAICKNVQCNYYVINTTM